MKKNWFLWISALLLITAGLSSCSSDDDDDIVISSTSLYAIIKPADAQVIDITPSDYVLTLDNIVAVNPETGEFKLKNTEQIDSKASHTNVIQFYSDGNLLFEATLNNYFSSYLPTGLTFCHNYSDMSGMARYELGPNCIIGEDGKVIKGYPTEQQKQGMQRMYQILQKAGKVSSHIDYDFQLDNEYLDAHENVIFIQSGDGTAGTGFVYGGNECYSSPYCFLVNSWGSAGIITYERHFRARIKGSDIFNELWLRLDSDQPKSISELEIGETYDCSQSWTFASLTPTWTEAVVKGIESSSGHVTVVDKKKIGEKSYVVLRFTGLQFNLYTVNCTVQFEFWE